MKSKADTFSRIAKKANNKHKRKLNDLSKKALKYARLDGVHTDRRKTRDTWQMYEDY